MFTSVSSWKLESREGIPLTWDGRKCPWRVHGPWLIDTCTDSRSSRKWSNQGLVSLGASSWTNECCKKPESLMGGCRLGWCRMMLEICRNMAYKCIPFPLANIGGRRAYHIQIANVAQRLAKPRKPSLESANYRDPALKESRKGRWIWMVVYTMDREKVCFVQLHNSQHPPWYPEVFRYVSEVLRKPRRALPSLESA